MVFLAVLAGIGAAALGPRPWPTGEATFELAYKGTVAQTPVQMGAGEPVELSVKVPGERVLAVLPTGARPRNPSRPRSALRRTANRPGQTCAICRCG